MRVALAALHHFSERQVDLTRLGTSVARAALPFEPTSNSWNSGTFALTALQRTSATSSPLLALGSCVVGLDGTIDNCGQLHHALSDRVEPECSRDPLRLILAGYHKWGVEFPRYLLGEFAIVLWDAQEQTLLATRDPFGVRSLFYTVTDEEILLGSQLRQLLGPHDLALETLNEEYVANFLAARQPWGEATAFSSVKRLKAGHVLTVSRGHIRTAQYWDLRSSRDMERASESECFAEFNRLFKEAVSVYLGTPGRVWSELSGGLDSSSIVSMAHHLSGNEGARRCDLATVTLTWPDTPDSDEREWAEEVLTKHRATGHFVNGEGKFFSQAIEGATYRDDPHFGLLCYPLSKAEGDLLARFEVDVLLSGTRAELVVLPKDQEPYHLADFAKSLQLRALWSELCRWQEYLKAPFLSMLHAYVWRPLFRPKQALRPWNRPTTVPSWITPNFRHRTQFGTHANHTAVPRRFSRPSQQAHYALLRQTEERGHLGYLDWCVEVRLPFLYRPLVEFAFAVPWNIKIAPRQDKRLLRESMRGILPQRTLERRGWKSPTYAAFRTLVRSDSFLRSLERSSHLVNLGVFDQTKWSQTLHQARHGGCENFASFSCSMALECWLRSLAGEPS